MTYRKFAWIFGASAIVIALLYWEQAAVLYVLSTLAICALLLVVMFSNLEARGTELHEERGGVRSPSVPMSDYPVNYKTDG